MPPSTVLQALRLRQTAQRNRSGDWDFDAIFNREIYPALHRIKEAVVEIDENEELFPPVHLTGASNTITSDYQHKNVLVSHASATSLTLDAVASEEMPEGALIIIGQEGAGTVTLTGTGGVTIHCPASPIATKTQWHEFFLLKVGDLEWVAIGDFITAESIVVLMATVFEDRFIGHEIVAAGATNVIGELGWRAAVSGGGAQTDGIDSEPGHVGIRRLTPGAPVSTIGIDLDRANAGGASFGLIAVSEIAVTRFLVRYTNNLANDPCIFGYGNQTAVATAEIGSESFYVDIAAGGAFWRCSVRTGSVTTTQTTTVPIVAGSWILWEMQVGTAEIRFYADGALVHTATSGLPSMTAVVSPSIRVSELTNGNHATLDIDTFQLFLTT